MNNKKVIKKISLNISAITGILLVGIALSKEPINTKEKQISTSSVVTLNVISDVILIKSIKSKRKT